ncbi:GD24661 [Drosophila simulans]|uniref:GD24661 n=1 Tax=Drosophila simulans TaxID=7240 RepID=B4NTP9_DROSI|nr:GD24661 [Drosophila simulans]
MWMQWVDVDQVNQVNQVDQVDGGPEMRTHDNAARSKEDGAHGDSTPWMPWSVVHQHPIHRPLSVG